MQEEQLEIKRLAEQRHAGFNDHPV